MTGKETNAMRLWIVLLVAAGGWIGCSPESQSEPESPIARLSSSEVGVRASAQGQIMQERVDLIRDLVAVAETTHRERGESPPPVLAIDLLGFSRAEEATPWLVSHIAYENAGPVMEALGHPRHPCVRALIAIGLPAVYEILGRRLERVPYEHLGLYANVLRDVLGQEWAERLVEAEMANRPQGEREGFSRLLDVLKETG